MMTAQEAVEFICWRMDNGWYYGWDLMYNSEIDWAGHPGERNTRKGCLGCGDVMSDDHECRR